ncbi:MAG: hypothetical protein AN485_24155, partial [Anabaena sp. MDT14b]
SSDLTGGAIQASVPRSRSAAADMLAGAVEIVAHDAGVWPREVAFERVHVATWPRRGVEMRTERLAIVRRERQRKCRARCGQMAGMARANDDAGDTGCIERGTNGDRADGGGVHVRDGVHGVQQRLKRVPATELVDDELVLD